MAPKAILMIFRDEDLCAACNDTNRDVSILRKEYEFYRLGTKLNSKGEITLGDAIVPLCLYHATQMGISPKSGMTREEATLLYTI
jgi:hypothetical protein